jgi:TRAP-type C4-dicarboxylate transport system permease small subunit
MLIYNKIKIFNKLVLDVLLKYCLYGILIGIISAVLINIFYRYVLSLPIREADEISRLLLIYMGFLGAVYAYRRNIHISVKMIPETILKKGLILKLTFLILFFILHIILIKFGWEYALNMKEAISPGLEISMMWMYLSVPLSALLMFLQVVENIIEILIDLYKPIFKKS